MCLTCVFIEIRGFVSVHAAVFIEHLYLPGWLLSRVHTFATLWTVAHQAPLSVGSPRQGYWGELPFSSSRGSPQPSD